MEFRDIALGDKEWIDSLLRASDYDSADYNFTVMFIWREIINTNVARHKDLLLVRFAEKKKYEKPFVQNGCGNCDKIENPIALVSNMKPAPDGEEADVKHAYYLFPAGKGNDEELKESINQIVADSEKLGAYVVLVGVLDKQVEFLQHYYPGRFDYQKYRNNFDYVYNASDLLTLKGKKYQSKRNFISRFKRAQNWLYEEITDANIGDCSAMNTEWCKKYGCSHNPSLFAEGCSVKMAIKYYKELGLKGGLLRLDGKVVAFTLGEMTNSNTFLVHIEKAFADVAGAYPTINYEFLQHNASMGFSFVNREDDTGDEGLRKSKTDYHPVKMIEKTVVTLKGHNLEIIPE